MSASKLSVLPACLVLIAHTLAACALIEPVSPDAQLPEPDASVSTDEESEAEGLSDLLATESRAEARPEPAAIPPDAAPIASAAGQHSTAEAQVTCEADWQCAASEYCSRVRRQCSARCQDDTCLGPTISETNDRLVSDGTRVCYADDSEAPGSGQFALRTWDGVAPRASTLTVAQKVRALLLDSHYCYFHAAGALRRAALSGGCVELLQEMAEPPARIWSSETHVSWSASAAELFRVAPAQNARIERVEARGYAPGQDTAADAGIPGSENTYATSTMLGEGLIQRHAAEGRLQVTRTDPSVEAIR